MNLSSKFGLFSLAALVLAAAVWGCSESPNSSPVTISPNSVPDTLGDIIFDSTTATTMPLTTAGNEPTVPPTATTIGPAITSTEPPAPPTTTAAPPPATTKPAASFPDVAQLSLTPLHRFDSLPLALATHANFPDKLFFALRDGRVVTLTGSTVTEVLNMGDEVSTSSELGLTGLAFSPDGHWLLTMSHGNDLAKRHSTNLVSQVYAWELQADGQTSQTSRRLILEVGQPYGNHNGGDLAFGPDGKLYIGLGDGGLANDPLGSGQDLTTLLGAVLRIEPNLSPISAGLEPGYTIPADNPYAGSDQAAPEIWISGARNPWRLSFDSATGDLWVADVGQNAVEEINQLKASEGGGRGANLGWNAFEGSQPFNPSGPQPQQHTLPVFEYSHSQNNCASVTGGYVYRGSRLAGYDGVYLYGDYCYSTIFGLVPGVANLKVAELPAGEAPASFGRDGNGELYVLTQHRRVYQLNL